MPDFSSRDLWFRGELCCFWVLISEGHFCRCPHAAHTPVLCAPLCPHCCSPTLLLCSSIFFSGLFPPLLMVGGTSTWGYWGLAAACPHTARGSPGAPGPLTPLRVMGIQGSRCGSVPTPQHAGPLCISFHHRGPLLGGFHPPCSPSPPTRGCE